MDPKSEHHVGFLARLFLAFRAWWRAILTPSGVPFGESVASIPQLPPGPNASLQLPSKDEAFEFQVDLFIRHNRATRGDVGAADALAIARCGIRRRASEISSQLALSEDDRLRDELTLALRCPQRVGDTDVLASAELVSVRVDSDARSVIDQHRQDLMAATGKKWRREARLEEMHFVAEIITEPVMATAWWLTAGPDDSPSAEKVGSLCGTAQDFQQLRSLLGSAPARSEGTREIEGTSQAASSSPLAEGWAAMMGELRENLQPAVAQRTGLHMERLLAQVGREDLIEGFRELWHCGSLASDGDDGLRMDSPRS